MVFSIWLSAHDLNCPEQLASVTARHATFKYPADLLSSQYIRNEAQGCEDDEAERQARQAMPLLHHKQTRDTVLILTEIFEIIQSDLVWRTMICS